MLRILLEGPPGVGKTTLAERLAERLRDAGLERGGFLTREIREGRRRVGFEIETFAGARGVLAHVDFPGPPRVGKYGVDLAAFERLALPALEEAGAAAVVIVDELGKMELASQRFQQAVTRLFDGSRPLVATVHAYAHAFTDALKRRPDVERVRISAANRDRLPAELAARLIS